MYGSRREFEGRITGFTMGTGETLSLLPPQNATGNFVKIVQRLPVRIELTNYDPDKDPLFVGLSVTPYVYYKEPPSGAHAGDCSAIAYSRAASVRRQLHDLEVRRPLPGPVDTGGAEMSTAALAPTRDQPPGGQPLVRRHRRGHSDVHGSGGHDGGQRGAALHCRRAVGGGHRQRMGHHQLPGRQRLHPADHRLAFGPHRPPQLFPALDRRLYPRLGALRHGRQPAATDPVPRAAGPGRRRTPALAVRRSCWTAFRARNKARP